MFGFLHHFSKEKRRAEAKKGRNREREREREGAWQVGATRGEELIRIPGGLLLVEI